MNATARVTASPTRMLMGVVEEQMGVVEEQTWTCVAAEENGAVLASEIGKRTVTRHVHFAFRAEAEAWAEAQKKEGWTLRSGPMSCATPYFGETDSPSNCWSVEAERAA